MLDYIYNCLGQKYLSARFAKHIHTKQITWPHNTTGLGFYYAFGSVPDEKITTFLLLISIDFILSDFVISKKSSIKSLNYKNYSNETAFYPINNKINYEYYQINLSMI